MNIIVTKNSTSASVGMQAKILITTLALHAPPLSPDSIPHIGQKMWLDDLIAGACGHPYTQVYRLYDNVYNMLTLL